jgi:hypothetical protein
MTRPALAFRISRTSQGLALGPPVPLPLLSHGLEHSVGGRRAHGTYSGPSVSCHYSRPPWGLRELRGPATRALEARPCSVTEARLERDGGAPCRSFKALTAHRPSATAWPGRQSMPGRPIASEDSRAPDECAVPPLDIGVWAIRLSPSRAGVAGPCRTRLQASPAFHPCACPLALSGLGKVVASASSAWPSGLLRRQFAPCVPWRTLSPHPAPASLAPRAGRGCVTVHCRQWTWWWQLGCKRTRLPRRSEPPRARQMMWWLCPPVTSVMASVQIGQRPFCSCQRWRRPRRPWWLSASLTPRRCSQ